MPPTLFRFVLLLGLGLSGPAVAQDRLGNMGAGLPRLAEPQTAPQANAPAIAHEKPTPRALRAVPDRSADGQFGLAMTQARAGDYDAARAEIAGLDPVAQDLLGWVQLRRGEGTMAGYVALAGARPNWPDLPRLREETEASIAEEADPAEIIRFFEGAPPETGQGALALAAALRAQGRAGEADDVLRKAWQRLTLTGDEFARFTADHGPLLAPLHEARTDRLLWRYKTDAARRMLPLLDEEARALAEARIALLARARGAGELYSQAQRKHPNDAGLAHAQFSWLAARGHNSDAAALALQMSGSAETLGEPFRWSGWRRSLARWLMRKGEAKQAYEMAAQHFLTPEDGSNYADLEWLSGYLALTYLSDPERALTHFERFRAAVVTPISLGRAWYWTGAALESAGLAPEAALAWRKGAEYQTSFYGQLAAEKAGLPFDAGLAGAAEPVDWAASDMFGDDLIRATDLLVSAGERGYATLFARQAADQLDRADLEALAAYLLARDEVNLALLMAKSAAARGILLPKAYYPIHPLAAQQMPVEPALALAIARQESEFRADAGSPVGALGIMQLMPGTARDVARGLGLRYSKQALVTDWPYNVRLGSQYLAGLIDEFGQSPVLVAAGYNAGPGRPAQWIGARGDPRDGKVDPVWWVEHIPFRETRNYVMRVSEAIPVYRARLAGKPEGARLGALISGAGPKIRPRARPTRAPAPASEATPAPAARAPAAAADAEAPQPRPRLRP